MSIARTIGLGRVRASHTLDNPASAHVLRKVGFRPTGRVEQRFLRARQAEAACAEMEDAQETLMRDDMAAEIYVDRALVAA